MRHLTTKQQTAALLALALLLLSAADLPGPSPAAAQVGADAAGYDLTWSTVDGGGHTFNAGEGYALGGTAGQPDAGLSFGGGYTLAGGFWGGGVVPYRLYLPIVLRAF